MSVITERYKSDREFKSDINKFFDGEIAKNGSILLPNMFGITVIEGDRQIDKGDKYKVFAPGKIIRNFSSIDNDIWLALKPYRKILLYEIVGFMANTIKYDSNAIRISHDAIRSYINSNISARDITECINILEVKDIIRRTNSRGIYAVNPLRIFKGDVYSFSNRINDNKLYNPIIDKGVLNIDQAVIYTTKEKNKGFLIKNKEYHSPYTDINDYEEIKCEEFIEIKPKPKRGVGSVKLKKLSFNKSNVKI